MVDWERQHTAAWTTGMREVRSQAGRVATRTHLSSALRVTVVNNSDYASHYMTLSLHEVNSWGQALGLYRDLHTYIESKGIRVVYEKCFGCLSMKGEFQETREDIWGKRSIPCPPLSYVEGWPVSGNPLSTINVYGILPFGTACTTEYVMHLRHGVSVGTLVNAQDANMLYLMGLEDTDSSAEEPYERFVSVYSDVAAYLNRCSFPLGSLVRSWIYLKDIASTYTDFNRARNESFSRFDIDYGHDSEQLPSSTCVGGKAAEEALIGMDLVCVDKKVPSVVTRRLYNPMQCEAEGDKYPHKPAFSRGFLLQTQAAMQVQVSGTASIGRAGETTHVGDAYSQIKESLTTVAKLLEPLELGLKDLCFVTCFLKQQQDYEHYLAVVREMGLEVLGDTCVIGEICRHDLLFEIDGIAVKQLNRKGLR
jgi:enamine deaminase RidA (YjgF/YER057c/UK114 family)